MKEQLINHLVTIIVKSENELNGLMISEDEKDEHGVKIIHHDCAIKNIERKMNHQYRIPYVTRGENNLADMIYSHTEEGNILILNRSIDVHAVFNIYVPEFINDIQKGVLMNCLTLLDDSEIYLTVAIDGLFHTVDLKEYLHNNQKNLTIPLHFENN